MVCQETCYEYSRDEQAIAANTTICGADNTGGSRQVQLLKDFGDCTDWTTLTTNNSATCVLGSTNEGNCGYGGSTEQLCSFCAGDSPADCCYSGELLVYSTHGLLTGRQHRRLDLRVHPPYQSSTLDFGQLPACDVCSWRKLGLVVGPQRWSVGRCHCRICPGRSFGESYTALLTLAPRSAHRSPPLPPTQRQQETAVCRLVIRSGPPSRQFPLRYSQFSILRLEPQLCRTARKGQW
jgi:hypothetical protein